MRSEVHSQNFAFQNAPNQRDMHLKGTIQNNSFELTEKCSPLKICVRQCRKQDAVKKHKILGGVTDMHIEMHKHKYASKKAQSKKYVLQSAQ
jgi:hypothetical protein